MRFEDHALDLIDQAIGDTFRRAKLLDELLGKIPGARKRRMTVGVAAIEGARDRGAAAPGQCRRRVADEPARPSQKGRADVLVRIPTGGRDRVAARGDHVGQGRLSRSPRADDRDKAGVERDIGRGGPIRIVDPDVRDDLRRHGRARRLFPDISAALRVDAGLTEGIELQGALDPREAIVDGLAHGFLVMGVAAVETGLASVISRAQVLDRHATLAVPEFALRRTARKDNASELLDLLTDGGVGGLADA